MKRMKCVEMFWNKMRKNSFVNKRRYVRSIDSAFSAIATHFMQTLSSNCLGYNGDVIFLLDVLFFVLHFYELYHSIYAHL